MKTFIFLLFAGTTTAQNATQMCDMGAIMASLLPNGTTWHDSCAAATGVDVFQISTFPTKEEAKSVQRSRDCVNYINQLNQEANTAIQCEATIGTQTIAFASLLTDLLKGQSSIKTKKLVRADSMSGSMSDIVLLSLSSDSTSSSEASESTMTSSEAYEQASRSPADAQERSNGASTSSTSVATATTFSIMAVAATTMLAFAL